MERNLNDPDATLGAADLLLELGDTNRARSLTYGRFLETENLSALFYGAKVNRVLRQHSEAVWYARRLMNARLISSETLVLVEYAARILGSSGFDNRDYRSSMRGYAYLISTSSPIVRAGTYTNYGVASAIMGLDEQAYRAFLAGLNRYPQDTVLWDWYIDAVYARHGWDAAWREWQQTPWPWTHQSYPRALARHLYAVELDLAGDARAVGASYAEFFHCLRAWRALAVMHGSVNWDHPAAQALVGSANTTGTLPYAMLWTQHFDDVVPLFDRILALYQGFPVKPSIDSEAVLLSSEAARLAEQGDVAGATWAFDRVLQLAPWWPEAHYNFALLLTVESSPGERSFAQWEFGNYLRLAPQGPNRREAERGIREQAAFLRPFRR